jgi:hypothetical protein
VPKPGLSMGHLDNSVRATCVYYEHVLLGKRTVWYVCSYQGKPFVPSVRYFDVRALCVIIQPCSIAKQVRYLVK